MKRRFTVGFITLALTGMGISVVFFPRFLSVIMIYLLLLLLLFYPAYGTARFFYRRRREVWLSGFGVKWFAVAALLYPLWTITYFLCATVSQRDYFDPGIEAMHTQYLFYLLLYVLLAAVLIGAAGHKYRAVLCRVMMIALGCSMAVFSVLLVFQYLLHFLLNSEWVFSLWVKHGAPRHPFLGWLSEILWNPLLYADSVRMRGTVGRLHHALANPSFSLSSAIFYVMILWGHLGLLHLLAAFYRRTKPEPLSESTHIH